MKAQPRIDEDVAGDDDDLEGDEHELTLRISASTFYIEPMPLTEKAPDCLLTKVTVGHLKLRPSKRLRGASPAPAMCRKHNFFDLEELQERHRVILQSCY